MTLRNIEDLQAGVTAHLKTTICINKFNTYLDHDNYIIEQYCTDCYPIYNRDAFLNFFPNKSLTENLFKSTSGIKGQGYFYNFIEPINPSLPQKQKINLRLPLNIMIDIDFKTDESFNQLKSDTGINFKDINEGLEYIYNLLKADNKCLYLDYSFSGKGIKAILTFISDVYKDEFKIYGTTYDKLTTILNKRNSNKNITKDEQTEIEKHTDLVEYLQKNNFSALCFYLEQFKLKYHYGSKNNYIDNCAGKPTQGTFQSKGLKSIINHNYEIQYYEIDQTKKNNKPKTTYNNCDLSNNDITRQNEDYILLFKNHYDNADLETVEKINKFLFEKIFASKKCILALPLLYSLYYVNDDKMLIYFYELMKKFNAPESTWHVVMNTFDKFKRDIKNLKPIESKTRLLSDILAPLLKIQNVKFELGCDFLGYKYTHNVAFADKLTEKQDEIFDIYDNHSKIIENAPAGAGKTTLNLIYAAQKIKDNQEGLVILVIPKNMLLKQLSAIIKPTQEQLNKENIEPTLLGKFYVDVFGSGTTSEISKTTQMLRDLYADIDIVPNYGNKKAVNVKSNSIILSSTPKVDKFKNAHIKLLLVDEIQDLVSFSREIKSDLPNRHVDKVIMMSATPESYLIGENLKGFAYIKCTQTNEVKKTLHWIRTESLKYNLFELINTKRKQLVYMNNIKTCESFIEYIKKEKGLDFKLLRANENDKHCIEITNTQKLTYNHYFATSYINAGINFINDKWDDIIILNNRITNPFDIYQLVNRFRNCTPHIVFIRERHKDLNREISFTNINKGLNKIYQKAIKKANKYNEIGINAHKKLTNVFKVNNLNFANYKYVVNKDSIKLDRLNNHFFEYYYLYDDVCYHSLSYYFNIIQYEQKKIIDEFEKISNNELLKIWIENWQYIVTHTEYVNVSTLFELPDDNIDKIISNNIDFFNTKKYQYNQALNKLMTTEQASKITFKGNIHFQNELEKFEIAKIMSDNNKMLGAGAEIAMRQTIDNFKMDISGLNFYHLPKKNVDVYSVNDICEYFIDSGTKDNYMSVNDEQLFNPKNQKNMTRFLNKYIGKCWKAKIDGKLMVVVDVKMNLI